jgi:colanic acid biosynthesis glycosyl transferase WcaI
LASVLIIGVNYRPETTGIAPYTTAIAEHFAKAGHRVTMLTGFPHYPGWRLDEGEHRFRVDAWLGGVRVLRRRHYVPNSQSAIRRALYEGTFLMHAALSRPERPDVVFGVIPSLSGGVLARLFAARARAPYGLLFQDLMGPAARQSGIQGGGRVAGVTSALERWVVARARTVAIVADSFRPYLEDLGVASHRIESLPNWTHVRASQIDRATLRARLGWPPDQTVVLHAGNMGLKQGLEQVVDAARRAAERSLPILYVLMGDGSQRTALEARAAGIDRMRFMPFQPADELLGVLEAADVLLVSERPTIIDMSLPSKLTSYFAAGRPVVAAVPAAGSTAHLVSASGAGVTIPAGDPDGLNEAVAHLRADPTNAAAMGSAGRAYAASELDEASALDRVDGLLERTLGATSSKRRSGWRSSGAR